MPSHEPQWNTLAVTSVSQPSATPFTQSARPALQLMPQLPSALHTGVPPLSLHTLSHEPQLVGFDRSASQPFFGLPSQSAKPASQVVILHTPRSHCSLAWSSA